MSNYFKVETKDQWQELNHELDNLKHYDAATGVLTRVKVEDGKKYFQKDFVDDGLDGLRSIMRDNRKKDRMAIKDSEEEKMRLVAFRLPTAVLHYIHENFGMWWADMTPEEVPYYLRVLKKVAPKFTIDVDDAEKEKSYFTR